MKLSVIIPVYNRQKAALRAARSALHQELDNMELIIVDDGSSPPFQGGDELKNDDRVTILYHDINKGAAAARNTGITHAKGEYIAFLDSDDIWRKGKLASQLSYAAHHENSDDQSIKAYVCGFMLKSAVTGRQSELQPVSSNQLNDFVSGCWYCPGSTLLVRRTAFDHVGLFDEKLRRLEDIDWFIRFSIAGGSLHSVDGIFSDIEAATKPGADLVRKCGQRILEKYQNGDKSDLLLAPTAMRYLRSYLALEQASCHVARGNMLKAIKYLTKSFLLKPRAHLQLGKWWH